jgi:hypothetical protein
MSTTYEKVKKWGKGVIGYSDDAVPVVSVSHWVRRLSEDPKRDVRPLHIYSVLGTDKRN